MVNPSILINPKYAHLVNKQPLFFRLCKKLFEVYCKIIFKIYNPLIVYGQGNLPKTSYIFSCNHNSHMDVALLSISSGKGFNQFGMLAAKDYWFDSKLRQFFINAFMNLIPIDRKSNGIRELAINDTLTLCDAFMKKGNNNIIMFPEGTRGVPGEICSFKKGVASFSASLKVPIVPAFIKGSDKAWPRGKNFIRPGKIEVHILQPIYPDHFEAEDNYNLTEKITAELEKRIRKKGSQLNV